MTLLFALMTNLAADTWNSYIFVLSCVFSYARWVLLVVCGLPPPCALFELTIASADAGALRTANVVLALFLNVVLSAFVYAAMTIGSLWTIVAMWWARTPVGLASIVVANELTNGAIREWVNRNESMSFDPIFDFAQSIPDSVERTYLIATASAFDYLKASRDAWTCPPE